MKFRKFINFLAYIGIVFLAIAMLLNAMPNKVGEWSEVLVTSAMIIEVAVGVIYSYLYARSKQQYAFMIVFGVSMIIIITLLVVRLVG